MSPSDIGGPFPELPTFRLPDLLSQCPFPVFCHPNGAVVSDASTKWYENGCSHFTDKKRREMLGIKTGLITACVYHDSDDDHLRVICDFMNYIFHLDDLSDGLLTKDNEALTNLVTNALESPHSYRRIMPNGNELPEQEPDVSALMRDFWARCTQDAGPGFQARFSQNLIGYMATVILQAQDRDNGVLPSLKFYTHFRRDNSGVWPLIDALEYTLHIDLPEDVIRHPIVKIMKDCVNDFVSWSNDIFSFNVEQARGDTFNLVTVLMKHRDLDIQGAVDKAADMCYESINTFQESKSKLPSWGPEVDNDVSRYVRGLESWISGSLYWSFASERYFGLDVLEIKQSQVVRLLPPKGLTTQAETTCKPVCLTFRGLINSLMSY